MKGSLVDRTIPKEAERDLLRASYFCTESASCRERYAAAHNRRLSDAPDRRIGQVHGAAPALADSCLPAHELGHQRLEACPLANWVSVRPMRAGHEVIITKRHARPNDGGLVTNARVKHSGNASGLEKSRTFLFEYSNSRHAPIRFKLLTLAQ